jgi:MFS family permease
MTRDINVGDVLSRVFAIYASQAAVLLPVALAVFVLQAVVGGILVSISAILFLVALLIQIIAQTLYSGMVVELVNDVQDGRRDHSIGGLFRAVTGVVVPLIVAGILVGIAAAIGFVLLIVPGLIVLTFAAVVAPSIVVERLGVADAIRRSIQLVKGNALSVFLVILVVFAIGFVVGFILGVIGGAVGDAGGVVANIIASTLTAPIAALAAGVLYFELRRAHGELGGAPHAPGPDAVDPAPATTAFPTSGAPGGPRQATPPPQRSRAVRSPHARRSPAPRRRPRRAGPPAPPSAAGGAARGCRRGGGASRGRHRGARAAPGRTCATSAARRAGGRA